MISKLLQNMKLQSKFALLIVSCVVMLSLVFLACSFRLVHSYHEMLYKSTAESISVAADNLSDAFYTGSDISMQILTNSNIQDNLVLICGDPTPLVRKEAVQSLYHELYRYSNAPYLHGIQLDFGRSSRLVLGRHTVELTEKSYREIEAAALDGKGAHRFLIAERADGSPQMACTRQIRRIRNMDLTPIGTVTIFLDLEKMLSDSIPYFSRQDGTEFYLSQGSHAIFPFNDPGLENYLQLGTDSSYQVCKIGDVSRFVVQKKVDGTPYTCILAPVYRHIFRQLIQSNILFVLVVLGAAALAIAVSRGIIRHMLQELDTLIRKINFYKQNADRMKYVESEDQTRHGNDELGILHTEFDDMMHRLNTLIEDNYVKQLLLKDTQLKALQQQINPHFLYNTLNIISWEAQALDAPTIPVIVESLSALLRGALKRDTELQTLRQELELLQHYLRIQQLRYGDRLTCREDIDSGLLDISVPKLMLQPLVENAIKYSLEAYTEPCLIRISARREDNLAVISVSNTGSEIDPLILQKLDSGTVTPNGFGIGLSNIQSRIRLIFGEKYGLTFLNHQNTATVEIHIPIQKEDIHAEDDYCR